MVPTRYFFQTQAMSHQLSKEEKLCSRKKIDTLFAEGQSFAQYPLRIVYRIYDKTTGNELPQFFISVPKRKFKRAVKRVWLRRRIREAYRLHKDIIGNTGNKCVDMAFLYIAAEQKEYHIIEQQMIELLKKLSDIINKANQ